MRVAATSYVAVARAALMYDRSRVLEKSGESRARGIERLLGNSGDQVRVCGVHNFSLSSPYEIFTAT